MGNHVLTDSDAKTILFTLSVLPSLEMEETKVQADINHRLCLSAAEKLINHRTDLTANEWRVIYSSILACQLINRGEFEVDAETKKECVSHLFSINKLVSSLQNEFPKLI